MSRYVRKAVSRSFILAFVCFQPVLGDDVTAQNPLRPPLFSIDRNSSEVLGGFLAAADLLLPGPGPLPDIVIPAENISLFSPFDDIDALSVYPWNGGLELQFAVLFSVDRAALGAVGPEPTLVAMGFPFNVQDQAMKHQAAGDAFMSLLLFTRMGPLPVLRGSYAHNNTLVTNQGDAGGVHFQVSPRFESPSNPVPPGQASNVNAGGGALPPRGALRAGGPIEEILFSLTSDSPSLAFLPGPGSGADIYVDRNPSQPGQEQLYVAHLMLGLQWSDDIDAMIVIDDDSPFSFQPGIDQVIFSLAPDSPSLMPPYGPGDLFVSNGTGFFEMFCSASALGLFAFDNVDLLDYVPCDDILPSVLEWAIGYAGEPCIGDLDGDRDVDIADLAILLSAYGFCSGDPAYLPAADFNENGCIDISDLATLLAHYGEICPPGVS